MQPSKRPSRESLKGYSARFLEHHEPSDQQKGLPCPPIQREPGSDQQVFDLPAPAPEVLRTGSIYECIRKRKSHRAFKKEALTLEELSFLLWATQGVREASGAHVLRTVPSAGNRHPLDTWLAIFQVQGLEPGLYRYLPLGHRLVRERQVPELKASLIEACCDQRFAGESAVTFIWTAVPYRTEWRYGTRQHKAILEDAGHACQNLYLAAEAIGCGACAIGAYMQEPCDRLLDVDGIDEFTLYLAPVGRVE